jgi:hypothetical protein
MVNGPDDVYVERKGPPFDQDVDRALERDE